MDSPTPVAALRDRLEPRDATPWPALISIDDEPVQLCDTVEIHFSKADSFNRASGADDPLLDTCFDAVNNLLSRPRIRAMAAFIRPINRQTRCGAPATSMTAALSSHKTPPGRTSEPRRVPNEKAAGST